MKSDVLVAVRNIVNFQNGDLRNYSSTYLNRINAVGEQLEFYVKDALAGSFTKKQPDKEAEYQKVFSYLGNQNNPPDMIIKAGDAFEIKKIESPRSNLALNSSPPKDMLHSSDPRITDACKKCEGAIWEKKGLFYVVGYVSNAKIKYLFFVHGLCYAADKQVYEKLNSPLKGQITSVLDSLGLEKGETNELGKVRKVDPLGITELRIRGMWHIKNPVEVFKEIFKLDERQQFSLIVLVKKEKYDSFPQADRSALEGSKAVQIRDVDIKDPNNPARNMKAKLIFAGW